MRAASGNSPRDAWCSAGREGLLLRRKILFQPCSEPVRRVKGRAQLERELARDGVTGQGGTASK